MQIRQSIYDIMAKNKTVRSDRVGSKERRKSTNQLTTFFPEAFFHSSPITDSLCLTIAVA